MANKLDVQTKFCVRNKGEQKLFKAELENETNQRSNHNFPELLKSFALCSKIKKVRQICIAIF